MFSTMSAMDLPDKVYVIQNESSVFEYKATFIVPEFHITIENEVAFCLGDQNDVVLQKTNFPTTEKLFLVDHGLYFRIVKYENLQYHATSKSYSTFKEIDNNYRVLDKVHIRFN